MADHGVCGRDRHNSCDHLQRGRVLPEPCWGAGRLRVLLDWCSVRITSSSAVACVGDVLTLTGVFTLPGSTAGSIVYTAPTTNSSTASVSATGPVYAATQTLALTPAAAPVMVSAYTTSSKLVITYNEDVTCQTGAAAGFTYYYTGVASGFTGTVQRGVFR